MHYKFQLSLECRIEEGGDGGGDEEEEAESEEIGGPTIFCISFGGKVAMAKDVVESSRE